MFDLIRPFLVLIAGKFNSPKSCSKSKSITAFSREKSMSAAVSPFSLKESLHSRPASKLTPTRAVNLAIPTTTKPSLLQQRFQEAIQNFGSNVQKDGTQDLQKIECTLQNEKEQSPLFDIKMADTLNTTIQEPPLQYPAFCEPRTGDVNLTKSIQVAQHVPLQPKQSDQKSISIPPKICPKQESPRTDCNKEQAESDKLNGYPGNDDTSTVPEIVTYEKVFSSKSYSEAVCRESAKDQVWHN